MATERLTISCDDCVMAGSEACADCLVTFVVGGRINALPGGDGHDPAAGDRTVAARRGGRDALGVVELSAEQASAVRTLAGAGLVSELRFVRRAAG